MKRCVNICARVWEYPERTAQTIKNYLYAKWESGGLGREDPLGGGHGDPPQDSCLENPLDRGAWWAPVHGVAKSRAWLRDWATKELSLFTLWISVLFIYLEFVYYFWLCWVYTAVRGLPLVVVKGDHSPAVVLRLQQLWLTVLAAPRHVGSSRGRDPTSVPCVGRRILNHWTTGEVPFCTI